MKNVPTPSCGLPSWVLRFSCCCCAFRLSGTFRLSPCICWGLAITIFNLVFQSEIIRLAPEATAIAMSVYSGIYNVGIGAGALVGGFVCTHASIARIRLCRGYDRIVGGALLLGAVGAVIEKGRG